MSHADRQRPEATFTGEIHPFAAAFPRLSDDDSDALADDIAANGLQQPLILDQDGRLVDGINRLAACERAGVEPSFIVLPAGVDPIDWILSANVERRHLRTGQRAMARAMALQQQGKRKSGRWLRGSISAEPTLSGGWLTAMRQAGVVLDEMPNEAPAVLAGTTKLDAAYKAAALIRDTRAGKDTRLAELQRDAPDLAALVTDGMDLGEAYAAHRQRIADRIRKVAEAKEAAARLNDFAGLVIAVIAGVEVASEKDEPITISRDLRANVEKALRLLDERNVQTR